MSESNVKVISKGDFLKEKMLNMARWVTTEVGQENLSADIIAGINGRNVVEITALSGALDANSVHVTTQNWSGLVQLMIDHGVGYELQEVVAAVQRKPEMHEKFWRYMQLFVEVSRQ